MSRRTLLHTSLLTASGLAISAPAFAQDAKSKLSRVQIHFQSFTGKDNGCEAIGLLLHADPRGAIERVYASWFSGTAPLGISSPAFDLSADALLYETWLKRGVEMWLLYSATSGGVWNFNSSIDIWFEGRPNPFDFNFGNNTLDNTRHWLKKPLNHS